mgnify:CR=1 FL=1
MKILCPHCSKSLKIVNNDIFGPVSGVLYCYNSKCKGHKWKMTSIELDAGSKEVTA